MKGNLDIRTITEMNELENVIMLEDVIWGNATPVHQTFTAVNNGGLMLGAYDGKKLVGFSYSFAGFDGKEPYLYSHMLGLLPAYRKAGLGERMKQRQAKIAEEMGYAKMIWTFDPLQSLNAYLNVHKLGATGAIYKEDYYGEMDDGLNKGMPTDRMFIEWRWNDQAELKMASLEQASVLLSEQNGKPVMTDCYTESLSNDVYAVTIPSHIQDIKDRDLLTAIEWRMKSRQAFVHLFSQGYQAHEFIRDTEKPYSYYYFTK
ncbi:hypothetical protein M948_03790 [Virgibacillus sp. CM-4]|uniref:GNAT family N-acetyltransferase n=1 Tax=Virgibacillus sp. CM-4 TaxID=1354277 RepID=UPI00038831F7|nr:GNAT family N-acetyltransferase [Virgibacillus sp. CM-4]EQB37687.1 hypothetical protein M948_03790 [Virgibacillus sp. CM-4]